MRLGERVYLREKSVLLCEDGSVLAIVERREDGAWRTCIERVTDAGIQASAEIPPGAFGATPVIAPLGAASIAVLSDHSTVTVFDSGLEPQRTFEISRAWPEDWVGTTAGGVARTSRDGAHLIRLTDPVSFQNSRAIAALRLTETDAAWVSWQTLAREDFPMSGPRAKSAPAPVVGDVLDAHGTRFVVAEGSDSGSVNKYGSDFFTLATLDDDGRVLDRLYEESGWKDLSGKHGISAWFTSDSATAILRPVFRTGKWKGRPHLLDLADGSIREFPRVTGAASFAPADLRGANAVFLSDDSLLFARFED